MKRTSSMNYVASAEATELRLYAENTYSIYRQIECVVANLKKKAAKGLYDSDKAIEAWYYVADAASKAYNKDFGYKFTVTERWSAAVELEETYREEVLGE